MIRILLVLLVTCYGHVCMAAVPPKTDSLLQVLKTPVKGEEKVTTLNLLGRELFLANKHDTAVVVAEQALKQAEKLKFKKGMAASYSILGNVRLLRGDYDGAYSYHSKALLIHKKLGDKKLMCDTYNNLALIHYYQGDLPESMEAHLKSLKLAKEIGNKIGEARSYSNLGNIYIQQADYDKAIQTFKDGYEIQKSVNDRMGMGRSLHNIGSVYLAQAKDSVALAYFVDCIKIKEEVGDILSIGRTYLNVAGIYFRKGYYKKSPAEQNEWYTLSETIHKQAITAFERMSDKQGLVQTYNNMGLLYLQKKQPHIAREYIDKGFVFAKEMGSKDDIKQAYNAYAVADSMAGDFKSSLANYKMFVLYRDSIINDANTKKTVEAEMNFAFEQKETKLKAEQQTREAVYKEQILREKIQGWSIAGGIALILLSLVLFINRMRLKQKHTYQQQLNLQQKEQAVAIMDAQEQERKRIAEDLHDSLGHLLSTVKMNLQTSPGSEEQLSNARHLLNQASDELRNISFNLMPRVLEEEGLTPALNELAEKTRKTGKIDISFEEHDTQNISFDRPTQFNIYRIVQEAINNIIKHAGATEAGIQVIGQDKGVTIMIEDNGKGFNPDQARKGRGQKNMRVRTQWLNGKFQLDSTPGHGTTISIDIPALS